MALCDDMGDSKVTVLKTTLLETLRTNRAVHAEIYRKAQEGYRAAAVFELERQLADAHAGKPIKTTLGLVEPKEHTKDYDRVIRMLEMSQADTIIISETQFNQYVMDDWGWKQVFAASNSRYIGG